MNQRFYSLDVFRGATVALMILVNNPGSWSHIYAPLKHAAWHGCTPTDLVFPFFLFAVGNSMAFVMPKLEAAGQAAFLRKVLKRTALIFLIGLFLNWSPFIRWQDDALVAKTWENVRIFGVLQRIALCYCFASLIIYYMKPRGAFVAGATLLLLYWALCLLLGNPSDPYSLEGFWGTHLDRQLLAPNHIYKGEGVPFDPEGIASTIPAIVQVIFGYLVGKYILDKGLNYEMLANLAIAGAGLMFAGYCWDMSFPINKKIWTSSYVLFTVGLGTMVLAIFIYAIEFRKYKGAAARFFDVFGKNPLFIFFLSGFLPRIIALFRWVDHTSPDGKKVYTSALPSFADALQSWIPGKENASLYYALTMIFFYWFVAWMLNRKRIYIKV